MFFRQSIASGFKAPGFLLKFLLCEALWKFFHRRSFFKFVFAFRSVSFKVQRRAVAAAVKLRNRDKLIVRFDSIVSAAARSVSSIEHRASRTSSRGNSIEHSISSPAKTARLSYLNSIISPDANHFVYHTSVPL